MSNTSLSYSGQCPCGCGAAVAVTYGGFTATEVVVEACPRQRATGTVSFTVRRSAAPVEVSASALRHSTGLVTFA